MAERQPENIGEVLFKSLGKGLEFTGANLVPFMQAERQQRMEQLQFLMEQEEHKLRTQKYQLDLSEAQRKEKEAVERAADPTGYAKKQAAIEGAAQAAQLEATMQGLLPQATGQPTEIPFLNPAAALQNTGLPFEISPSGVSMDFGQPQSSNNVDALDFVIGQRGTAGGMDYLKKTGEFANLGDGTPKTLSAENQQLKTIIDEQYPPDVAKEVWQYKLQGIDPLAVAERNYQENVRLYTPVGQFGMKKASSSPEVAQAQARSAQEAKYSPVYKADIKTVVWGIRKKQHAGEYTKEEADALVKAAESHFKNLYQETLDYVTPEETSGE